MLFSDCLTLVICIFCIENQYRKEEVGHNCPRNKIIKSADKCENALKWLGLRPLHFDVNQRNRPAGCYWRSNGNGYFNHIFDPSSTNTNEFGNRGGVCSLAGKDWTLVLNRF